MTHDTSTDTPDTTTNTTAAPAGTEHVHLQSPLQRGSQRIAHVALRRPLAGQLGGIKLTELLQLDVETLAKVLPRITTPSLLAHEIKQLDPADLTELGAKVAGFFVKKEQEDGQEEGQDQ